MTVQSREENACSLIAWKTLRRPRIFLYVGLRSKTTFDQRREDNHLQKDNCVPLVVPGLSTSSGRKSSSLHCHRRTHRVHLQVLYQSEVTRWHPETGAIHPKPTKKRDDHRDADDRLRDLPEWLEEFTDKSRGHRIARTRTHFSGLRFGTHHESVIQEAQYLYSLPKGPKLRSKLTRAL